MIRQRIAIGLLSMSATAFVGLLGYEGYTGQAIIPVPGDVPTVGFGTTDGVKMGDTITPPKAVQRAYVDVAKYEGAIKQCVKEPLYQHEYDAFVSLAYNIGPKAFCGSTLVRRINAGDHPGACKEILRWNKVGGRVVNGLVMRREGEYRLCVGQS